MKGEKAMRVSIKEKVRKVGYAVPFATLAMAGTALASDSGTANTDVVTAMTTVANDMKATATSIIPVALTVVGISLVIVFGVRIFKKIAK